MVTSRCGPFFTFLYYSFTETSRTQASYSKDLLTTSSQKRVSPDSPSITKLYSFPIAQQIEHLALIERVQKLLGSCLHTRVCLVPVSAVHDNLVQTNARKGNGKG